MKNLLYVSVAAFAFALVANVESVRAQGYVGSNCGSSCPTCFGNFGSFGLVGSPYALGRVPTPPYFALHPPVYYSQPVPRTYGYSPFAYPGSMMTPNVMEPAAAKVMKNPYVPAQAVKKFDADLAQGLEIINPFVKEPTRMVSSQVR